jgi:hypothetical protein
VVEGSIPNEKLGADGYWAAMGTDPKTGQPITTMNGSTVAHPGRSPLLAPAPAPRTAASMPWKAIRPAVGDWLTV